MDDTRLLRARARWTVTVTLCANIIEISDLRIDAVILNLTLTLTNLILTLASLVIVEFLDRA